MGGPRRGVPRNSAARRRTTINLLHHLIAAECLRLRLELPEPVRGQMLLGALAPDAHTEAEGYDRTWLHPRPGVDPARYVTSKLRPQEALAEPEGRAFALAALAHVVADALLRRGPNLPPGAGMGLKATSRDGLDLPAMRRDLLAAPARFSLGPLTPAQIAAKRAVVLGRPPLADADGPCTMIPELAEAMAAIVRETLALAAGSPLLPGE